MQDFRRLAVWAKAHALALGVRHIALPLRGAPGSLRSQMAKTAESIVFNVVEGCGASTRREFARFLDISIKSCSELEYQLQFAKDCELIPEDGWQTLSGDTVQVRRMLYGLRRSVLAAEGTVTSKSSVIGRPVGESSVAPSNGHPRRPTDDRMTPNREPTTTGDR